MNRLKQLRHSLDITLRQLEDFTEIRNSALSQIENGKQPFREIHVQKLTSFFDVTSDYLLGYSNTGIGVYFDDNEHTYINEMELNNLKYKFKVKETIISNPIPTDWNILLPNEEIRLYNGKHIVFRSVDTTKENAGIKESVRETLLTELEKLNIHDLEKVLKFINDYIK